MRRKTLRATWLAAAIAVVVSPSVVAASTPQVSTQASSPRASTGVGAAVSAVRATVDVVVNPLGALTDYAVQYGTDTSYGLSSAIKTIAATASTTRRALTLHGLRPSTIYHCRVVATNLLGTTYGMDQTFSTWPVQIPFSSHGVVSRNNQISKPSAAVGWVMVIHGGGWQVVGPSAVAMEDNTVSYLNGLGWATYNVDYRRGEHSLPDVLAAYRKVRSLAGVTTPSGETPNFTHASITSPALATWHRDEQRLLTRVAASE